MAVSQSSSQVANQRVNQILAPQLAQQTSYGAHQNAVIRAFANSLLGRLQPIAGQVGGDYDAAIKQIGGLSANAASYLSGQNPAASQQALLNSVNAPASQQAQSQQQLGDTFNGGAGVLSFTQGVVPGSELAGNKAAAMAQARTLPAIGALAGQQSLASALYGQSQSRDKLLAQRPALVQQQENAIQKNNIVRAATKQRADAAQAKLDAKASEIDPSVSKLTGVLTYSDGTQAKGADGKPIPIVSGAGTAAKPFRYQDSYGREIQLAPDGTQTVLSEGNWTDSAGRTWRVGLNGKQTLVSTKPAATSTPHTSITVIGNRKVLVDDATGTQIKDLGPAPTTGRSSTSAPTTKTINGVTYQWDAGTKGWVRSTLPVAKKAATAKASALPDSVRTGAVKIATIAYGKKGTGFGALKTGGSPRQPYSEALRRVTAYLRGALPAGTKMTVIGTAARNILESVGYLPQATEGATPGDGNPPAGYAPLK